ncbi:MAG: single-stranded-DNA-specific exonuclease RecJ [Miltoncostaeaceae bacterium]
MSAPSWRAGRVGFAAVVRLQRELDVPEPLAWTLARRGLEDPEVAREFLAADGPLAPPGAIAGIDRAAERIATAVRRREPITVHGDYDCDGVVSTALLVSALRARDAQVEHFLPSRFDQGYGVAVGTVDALAERGCRLLVCVDCGTSAVDALQRAVDLGVEAVVLDHHLAGGVRVPAIIANPALGRPAPDLPAAAGVVHHLVRALDELMPVGLLGQEADAGLDLVAMATVADAVPLVGDNRRMVVRGLRALRERPRPGITALCAAAGTEPRTATARTLGFSLAPCINAAGRLAHPDRALELLLAPDIETATPIAQELWDLNLERRDVERAIVEEAVAMIEAEPPEIREAGAIVAAGDGWHEGVVGIVASRLVERFDRPAIVIARQDGRGKGSGRSLPGVDLHALVGQAAGSLTRWGGHAGAIGLELPAERIAGFRADLIRAAEGARASIDRARVRTVDAVAGCPDLTLPTAEALDALAPFGRGNPPVRLVVPAVRIEEPRTVGQGRHLQVRLRAGGAHARGIGFQMGPRAAGLAAEERYDAVVALEVERWQGVVGARVSLRGLEVLTEGPEPGWAAPCELDTPGRAGLAAALAAGEDPAPGDPDGPPLGVRDLRGRNAAVSTITALAGADRGVAVVVADLPARRGALETVIAPWRAGVEVACALDCRAGADHAAERIRALHGVPALLVIDHHLLGRVDLPPDMHLAVLDPPADAVQAAALARAGAGRWVHALWGPDDVELALAAARAEWTLRPRATDVWRALVAAGGRLDGGEALDAALLPGGAPGAPLRPAHVVARALRALAEVGLVRIEAGAVWRVEGAPKADLAAAPTCVRAEARLVDAVAWLDACMGGPAARLVAPAGLRGIVHA